MFTYPALLVALPLAGAVILIHLINMFRHRRIEWAALEFLLAGYRKSRTRILLQQLLLMLMRTLAVLAIILMLAQPKLQGPLAEFLGGARATHHVILIDDTYSMSDHSVGQTAFDDAIGVVTKILDNSLKNSSSDKFTIIPASQAKAVRGGLEPTVRETSLDTEGTQLIRNWLKSVKCSECTATPEDSFQAAKKILSDSTLGHRNVVYMISDFRIRDWENSEPVTKIISEFQSEGHAVRMVRAVDGHRPNLAIRSVRMIDGIHAADVPVLFEATIVNFGPDPVEEAQMSIRIDNRPQPGHTVSNIPAGGEVTVPIHIRLPGEGAHRVVLQMEPDTIACDNAYSMVLDFPAMLAVLIITPEAEPNTPASIGPKMLRNAIAPSGVRTGIRVQVENPRFLATQSLDNFDLIVFSEVPRMDGASIRALEAFVSSGKGAMFFTGPAPRTDPRFVKDELYKNGEGIFPVPLQGEAELPIDYLRNVPDLSVVQHPVLRLFGEGESPLLTMLRFEHYSTISPEFQFDQSENSTLKVIGKLRNGDPLILEKPYGNGKTITVLSTLDPQWNNWGRNPSYVITMLAAVSYLSGNRGDELAQALESPINIEFDPEKYENTVRFIPPSNSEESQVDPVVDSYSDATGKAHANYTDTKTSGFYEAILTRLDGQKEHRVFALNVNPEEGNLAVFDPLALADSFSRHDIRIESLNGFSPPFEFVGVHSLTDSLLIILILLLAGEMLLAGRILPPQK